MTLDEKIAMAQRHVDDGRRVIERQWLVPATEIRFPPIYWKLRADAADIRIGLGRSAQEEVVSLSLVQLRPKPFKYEVIE
jgi:hypothetical protein